MSTPLCPFFGLGEEAYTLGSSVISHHYLFHMSRNVSTYQN